MILAAACTSLDTSGVFAISITVPDSGKVEEGDTIRPTAAALDGAGDTIAALVRWATLDTANLLVVDGATGVTVGKNPPSGRLVARADNLISSPVTILVSPQADTILAVSSDSDSVSVGTPDSLSDTIKVALEDTSTSPGSAIPLAGRPVVFSITSSGGGSVTLVTDDTSHAVVTTDTVKTDGAGVAPVRVRLLSGTLPDTVVVTASAQHAVGTTVAGSPLTFVVEFNP